jgi:hypothetical protein
MSDAIEGRELGEISRGAFGGGDQCQRIRTPAQV